MNNSCDKCKYYLQGLCGGIGKVCEDYFATPQIPEEEKKYWEKEGREAKSRKGGAWYIVRERSIIETSYYY